MVEQKSSERDMSGSRMQVCNFFKTMVDADLMPNNTISVDEFLSSNHMQTNFSWQIRRQGWRTMEDRTQWSKTTATLQKSPTKTKQSNYDLTRSEPEKEQWILWMADGWDEEGGPNEIST